MPGSNPFEQEPQMGLEPSRLDQAEAAQLPVREGIDLPEPDVQEPTSEQVKATEIDELTARGVPDFVLTMAKLDHAGYVDRRKPELGVRPPSKKISGRAA